MKREKIKIIIQNKIYDSMFCLLHVLEKLLVPKELSFITFVQIKFKNLIIIEFSSEANFVV